jgi:DNA repair protein RadA/Sms
MEPLQTETPEKIAGGVSVRSAGRVDLSRVVHPSRIPSGIGELDRVLGGGWVPGCVVLLGGEPGIGKSTLLLQASLAMAGAGKRVLYASGEESESQIALRAHRVAKNGTDGLELICTNRVKDVVSALDGQDLLVADSVQTLVSDAEDGVQGSPSQVRAVALALINIAKERGLPVVLVGHITKSGELAGPKILEHMVDAVLHFSGEATSACRMLRGSKNRYGSVDETGLFEMEEDGLREIADASGLFWDASDSGVPGVAVTAVLEGTRPFMSEIQALAAQTPFPYPKRACRGMDVSRIQLLLAVLERRVGVTALSHDMYANAVGGLQIRDPGADLAISMAMGSALLAKPLPPRWCFLGEVGLAGEIRPVSRCALKVREAQRLGFTTVVVSARENGLPKVSSVVAAKSLRDAFSLAGLT